MAIGDRIRALVRQRGMKFIQLADRVGISPSHLSDIVNNKTGPSVKVLEKIADILNTTTDFLIKGILDDDVIIKNLPEELQGTAKRFRDDQEFQVMMHKFGHLATNEINKIMTAIKTFEEIFGSEEDEMEF
ncbi:MAG: helix-turn-helix transcriptional regulator [Halanaerobiales bacterium]|nr:helix-turn-helix transcriptional regulator [Halanaerobiales bacterium]